MKNKEISDKIIESVNEELKKKGVTVFSDLFYDVKIKDGIRYASKDDFVLCLWTNAVFPRKIIYWEHSCFSSFKNRGIFQKNKPPLTTPKEFAKQFIINIRVSK